MKTAHTKTTERKIEDDLLTKLLLFGEAARDLVGHMGAALGSDDITGSKVFRASVKGLVEAFKMADMNNYARDRGRMLPYSGREFEKYLRYIEKALQEVDGRPLQIKPKDQTVEDIQELLPNWHRRTLKKFLFCDVCRSKLAPEIGDQGAKYDHYYQRGKGGPKHCPICYKKRLTTTKRGKGEQS